MSKYYQPKLLPDGTPNPLHKPRNPAWRKQPSGKSGVRGTVYKSGEFVAWDGEGGDYQGRHVYNYFADSSGQSIYCEKGLSTKELFNQILEVGSKQDKRTINVIYGGSYDANMWLRDLPRDKLQEIKAAEGKAYTYWEGYEILYMPRKYFSIRKLGQTRAVKIWDVIGFFQGAFIQTLKAWIPDSPLLEIIIKGKSQRSQFSADDIDFIKEYCQAELDCLVEIMNRLREAITGLGLVLTRWDGAGAVAMAMLKREKVKQHFEDLPPNVETAATHAYFGGRIEIGKYGRHNGKVYHYDINSAYPAEQRKLPALKGGLWVKREAGFDARKSPNLLIVSLVKWSHCDDTAFCPFPYRSWSQQKVLFPSHGYNWIWKPELSAALDVRDEQNRDWNIEIECAYEFIPADDTLPYEWVNRDFDKRKQLVAESKRTGIPNGMEKVIKLGLNSLYGKTAQRAGYDEKAKRKPPYHNLAYAGHITSATRAALWRAAMQADNKIIALATDGIYSTVPLNLDCPKDKVLGLWEAAEHDEMILVQAGFYWIRDGEKLQSFSRGFDKMVTHKEKQETLDIVLQAWKTKQDSVRLPCTRFITLNTALISDKWFSRWCTWHEMITEEGIKGRELSLSPRGTKRDTAIDGYGNPHKNLIPTTPEYNMSDDLSQIYSMPWDIAESEPNETLIDIEHTQSYI